MVYGGQTKDAIHMTQTKIAQVGSTPGFGWYNIALARSYLYDGQLDSCDFFLTKASNFKEIHINTTLTQSQYEFTINLLRVQLLNKKAALIKFYNSGWWYSPGDLFSMLSLKVEKLMLEYALANALAYNPERKRIVYDLFCAETTVSYDESFYLLKNFNPSYFTTMYENYPMKDTRERVYRYFDLFVAKFNYQNGEEKKAEALCEKLLDNAISRPSNEELPNGFEYEHEKLFLARILELLALQNEGSEDKITYQNRFFDEYPQLMPFSGFQVKMNLKTGGEGDEMIEDVIHDLKKCNIDFVEHTNVPQANIQFSKKGNSYQALINVIGVDGKAIVANEQIIFKTKENVGRELALRLFGKGGAVSLDQAPEQTVAKK